MKLEEIGFYTLSDDRVKNLSPSSNLKRLELIITNRCNFNCLYCRKLSPDEDYDIHLANAINVIDSFKYNDNLENIRFSGGEPTLHKNLGIMVECSKQLGIKRIAISTNGSASIEYYKSLINKGVNDFSISLDACCSSDFDIMSGKSGYYDRVIDNIKELSKLVYTTLGIVLTDYNSDKISKLIEFGISLGASDIRIIPAAQYKPNLELSDSNIEELSSNYPILNYRLNNIKKGLPCRGLKPEDNPRCPLVLDDLAILNKSHYPCIIYMRENGSPVGTIKDCDYSNVRSERLEWYKTHNCMEDPICKKNCLDVCIDHNNKVRELNTNTEVII